MKKQLIVIVIVTIILASLTTAMAAGRSPVGTIQFPTTGSGGIIATRFTQEGELAPKEETPSWARRTIEAYTNSWYEAPGRLDRKARAWPFGSEKGLSTFGIYGWNVEPAAQAGGLGWPDTNGNGAIDSVEELQDLLWATVWPTEPYGLANGLTVARTSDPGYGSVHIKFKNVTLEIRKVRRTFHFNITKGQAVTTPVNGWVWAWAWAQPGTSTGSGKGNSGNSNGGTQTQTQSPTVKPTTTAPNQTQNPNPTATPAPTNQTQAPAPAATATPDPQLYAVPDNKFEEQMFSSSTPMPAPRAEQPAAATPAPTPAPAPADNTAEHIVLDVVVEPQGWTSSFEATQVASAPSSEGGRHRGTTEADTAGTGFIISTSSEGTGEGQPDPGLDECGPDIWDD